MSKSYSQNLLNSMCNSMLQKGKTEQLWPCSTQQKQQILTLKRQNPNTCAQYLRCIDNITITFHIILLEEIEGSTQRKPYTGSNMKHSN